MIDNKIAVLAVDDEQTIIDSISRLLKRDGYFVETASDGKTALKKVKQGNIDIAVIDVIMPGMDGISLLKEIKSFSKEIEVIVLTGHGSIPTAVETIKLGAFNYITKPFDNIRLKININNIVEKKKLLAEVERLKKQSNISSPYYPGLIGVSKGMQKVYSLIEKVADSNSNLIITGETGTGKEVVAKVIHNTSPRKNGPFVPVSCKALPESVLENELFGHEKGAFTDAKDSKKGYFEAAEGGTLFLDEITEIPPEIQVKLLRVIQDRKIYRLGKTQPINIDIRIIAATNKNIEEETKKGNFREDLYFRLNVVSIHVPPLRDRISDIPLLAEHFLKVYSTGMKKEIDDFESECFESFFQYNWPGNVRELENAVEHAVNMTSTNIIKISDLPDNLSGKIYNHFDHLSYDTKTSFAEAKEELLHHFYTSYIKKMLDKTKGNVSLAAKEMKIARSHLNLLIKKHKLSTK